MVQKFREACQLINGPKVRASGSPENRGSLPLRPRRPSASPEAIAVPAADDRRGPPGLLAAEDDIFARGAAEVSVETIQAIFL